MEHTSVIDPDQLKRYSFAVWSYKQGEIVSLMIHIGDRLGLYRALDGMGPVTAAQLAAKTNLQERWLLEWLRGQAAARLLDYHDGDRFELTPVGAAVLADEAGSLSFAAGAFAGQTPPETVDKLLNAFKTGIGLSYEELGPNAAHRTERRLGPWTRQSLVPLPDNRRRRNSARSAVWQRFTDTPPRPGVGRLVSQISDFRITHRACACWATPAARRSRHSTSQMNSTPVSVSLGSRVILSTIHQQAGYAPYPPSSSTFFLTSGIRSGRSV